MRLRWISLFVMLAATPWVMGDSCAAGDKYRASKNLLGVVELGPFPKQAANVGGYNLYISPKKEGPFERINDQPVLGLTRLMVPYLTPGQAYFFRMTSVGVRDSSKESAPGQVFTRVAKEKTE